MYKSGSVIFERNLNNFATKLVELTLTERYKSCNNVTFTHKFLKFSNQLIKGHNYILKFRLNSTCLYLK